MADLKLHAVIVKRGKGKCLTLYCQVKNAVHKPWSQINEY